MGMEKFFLRRVTYMFGKPSPSALLKRTLTPAEMTKTESANLNREYSKYH